MNQWPEGTVQTQANPIASDKPINYWLGLVLTFFFSGSGFALVNRLWPSIFFVVVSNAVSGPIGRTVLGTVGLEDASWPRTLYILLLILHFFWYRNAYVNQYKTQSDVRPLLSPIWRYSGIWLQILFLVLTHIGTALGWWLPRPIR